MSKKNIDKLFQEKLKDFGEVPDEKVWEAIDTSLDQKKKSRKRVIPIWWRLGGVAALLAILLYVINPFNAVEESNTPITNIEQADSEDRSVNSTSDQEEDAVVSSSEVREQENNEKSIQNPDPANTGSAADVVASQGAVDLPPDNASQVETPFKQDLPAEKQIEGVAERNDNKQNTVPNESQNQLDQERKSVLTEITGKEQAETAVVITEQEGKDEENKEEISEKKSIFDEIEENEEALVQKDPKGKKWAVGPRVAPVYFSSLGEGSPIHSSFASNSKSGNVNLSYGLMVSYSLGKKLSVRSGVHKVDYGYDTNDISFSSSLNASTSNVIDNITYSEASKNLVVESNTQVRPPQAFAADDVVARNPTREGSMVQQFGYLEVPLELNYALIDKKLGVNLIGGLSSLFLVDNSVTLESRGIATEIGEANNLNEVNFSTNIGIGINYELSPKMQLNLEPMFKYQMNTFSESDGNFEPFSIGVYSGLSFKF